VILLPVNYDAESDSASIINSENLDPWFYFKGVTVSPKDTELAVYQLGFEIFEYALLASSFGYVSKIPDTTGYGAWAGLVPSSLDQKSLATATMPIYSKGKGGMTKLSDKAMFMG